MEINIENYIIEVASHLDIDGGWSEWHDCNAMCGGGIQDRTCTNPPESGNGAHELALLKKEYQPNNPTRFIMMRSQLQKQEWINKSSKKSQAKPSRRTTC